MPAQGHVYEAALRGKTVLRGDQLRVTRLSEEAMRLEILQEGEVLWSDEYTVRAGETLTVTGLIELSVTVT